MKGENIYKILFKMFSKNPQTWKHPFDKLNDILSRCSEVLSFNI
jgi:hypothetical protein